jgi:hypothetical protein
VDPRADLDSVVNRTISAGTQTPSIQLIVGHFINGAIGFYVIKYSVSPQNIYIIYDCFKKLLMDCNDIVLTTSAIMRSCK